MNYHVRRFAPLLGVVALAQTTPALAKDSAIYTPKPGSRERKAILDTLRKPVTKFNHGKTITFTRVDMKVSNGWAYVSASTVDAKNKPIGPEFTTDLSALLEQTHGTWKVLEWAYHSDVISIEWERKHPAVPRRLWPHNRR